MLTLPRARVAATLLALTALAACSIDFAGPSRPDADASAAFTSAQGSALAAKGTGCQGVATAQAAGGKADAVGLGCQAPPPPGDEESPPPPPDYEEVPTESADEDPEEGPEEP